MNYHFLTPVWGPSYVKSFTEVSLPTQLSPGNLGAFVDEPNAVYKIMTRNEDVPHIKASRAFQTLDRMMKTEFVSIDRYLLMPAYHIFAKAHELGLRSAPGPVGATVFFFGVCDAVWSDGSFRNAKEILHRGKRAVLVSGGFHVVRETFGPELLKTFSKADSEALICPPRPLMDLAFEHVQIITRSMIWDNGDIRNRLCALLHWKLGDKSLLSRCWVAHPMAVRPRSATRMVDEYGNITTVDNSYVKLAKVREPDIHFVTDSDEILFLEVSPGNYSQSEHTSFDVIVPGEYSTAFVVDWLENRAGGVAKDRALQNLKHHVWYHSHDIPPDERLQLEKRSDEVISDILELYSSLPHKAKTSVARKVAGKILKPIVAAPLRAMLRLDPIGLMKRLFPNETKRLMDRFDNRVRMLTMEILKKHGIGNPWESDYSQEFREVSGNPLSTLECRRARAPDLPDERTPGSPVTCGDTAGGDSMTEVNGSPEQALKAVRRQTVPYVDLALQHAQIKDELLTAIARVLDHGDFILGEEVSAFESRFAELCDVRHAVGVNSGTDALILALRAVGVGQGDEVITTPNAFISCASSIALLGATPVFVDVREDYNIDPALIQRAISRRTRAVLVVHLTGRPADMSPILEIARSRGIEVIEDCAQAVGAEYRNRPVGAWGAMGCFSLHPLKNLSACGDGGIVTTDDTEVFEKLLVLRNLGLRNRDECVRWAANTRLDTMQAACLLVKLDYLDRWTEKRRANAAYYQRHLSGIPQVEVPVDRPYEKAVYHTFVIQAQDRGGLQAYLSTRGVETAIHYPLPIHLQAVAQPLGYRRGSFPVAESQADRILSLPAHSELKPSQLEYVAGCIHDYYHKIGA